MPPPSMQPSLAETVGFDFAMGSDLQRAKLLLNQQSTADHTQ